MPICREKKESIKSATIGIHNLHTLWLSQRKINEIDFSNGQSWLAKVEMCTNLDETYKLISRGMET